ncbi:MAG: hypothetical protein B7Y39_11525 [Bdellovibrio sp. 28-41-41]|nr:MAG: hypothetical protein B7Y39_11525 [Bdellovibrio sp. 28-41-41]
MGKMKELAIDSGEEVVQAIGELGATVNDATKAAAETEVDHEEVKGWLTTIFKVLMAAFKP